MTQSRGFAPLRHHGFRYLVAGQLASSLGDACYAVALPWYVLAAHGSALTLGTVLAAYGTARIALLAAGGHASDRWGPWTVMMTADAARLLAVTSLALTSASCPADTGLLAPIAVLLGAGDGLFLPAGTGHRPGPAARPRAAKRQRARLSQHPARRPHRPSPRWYPRRVHWHASCLLDRRCILRHLRSHPGPHPRPPARHHSRPAPNRRPPARPGQPAGWCRPPQSAPDDRAAHPLYPGTADRAAGHRRR